VARQVERLNDLIAQLDRKARDLVSADADLDRLDAVAVAPDKQAAVEHLARMLRDLKDLRWRYTEGPGGRGRATLGIANSTGCSSVWGSTYPYNPYPFPWVNHLFQDAPSIAIGLFEGHMRKMADGFVAIRRAELALADGYDPSEHEEFFTRFDWRQFTDEEFELCPPIFAVGGDGAMLDIGFQNLSRLLASGKPIRVVMLDTQVYSNTGGQACTSGFTGQVSDMAAWGKAQHGKEETRKELALLVIAHRNSYVLQGSQANPSHLLAGVIKGLKSRRPAVFSLHCPCPPEHGLADDQANRAAKHALESRAFPVLVYDPDAGPSLAECISLDGNPALDDTWPTYDLRYRDEAGVEQVLTVPMTIADWAATETRFRKHFTPVAADVAAADLLPFAEYMERAPAEREGITPFIQALDGQKRLVRFAASKEIVELAEDRLKLWHQLRQMAGLEMADAVREGFLADLEAEYERKVATVRADFDRQLGDLKVRYPQVIARRLAEGLLRAGGERTVADILAEVPTAPGLDPGGFDLPRSNGGGVATVTAPVSVAASAPAVATPPSPKSAAAVPSGDALELEAYIDTARCTSCDECININRKLFEYNDKKQAVIKDMTAGTFKDLVLAAERCPVSIIHPGTPTNPKEKGLDKLVARAAPFN
jgi:pyruvate-ferredoxin/flavodoxin oxidoreductase